MAGGGDSNVSNHLPVASSVDKSDKLKMDGQNGDNIAVPIGIPDAISDKSGNIDLQEMGCSKIMSEGGDAQQLITEEELERVNGDVNLDSLNAALMLKKVLVCLGLCASGLGPLIA